MVRVLHFSEADLGAAGFGRRDPTTNLPLRVGDHLKALDFIIETAINEAVDLVVFAGDAYHSPYPSPTLQREWGQRVMRLSRAGIPLLMVVGHQDASSLPHRAHALDVFATLGVAHVLVIDQPCFLSSADLSRLLFGEASQRQLPLQVIAIPWANPRLAARSLAKDSAAAYHEYLIQAVQAWLSAADPATPLLLAAHAIVVPSPDDVAGNAAVALPDQLTLPLALLQDERLDYVALGHSRRAMNLNDGAYPPLVYPGSIERLDFSEAEEDKFFVIAHLERGRTLVEWRKIEGLRPFIIAALRLEPDQDIRAQLNAALPDAELLTGAVVRLTLEYPPQLEGLIDEAALRRYARPAFSFQLVKHPQRQSRLRLPQESAVSQLSPLDLLKLYWESNQVPAEESEVLCSLAAEIIAQVDRPSDSDTNPP